MIASHMSGGPSIDPRSEARLIIERLEKRILYFKSEIEKSSESISRKGLKEQINGAVSDLKQIIKEVKNI